MSRQHLLQVPELIETIAALRNRLQGSTEVEPYSNSTVPTRPTPPTRLALVPTRGALHAGHVALIDAARRECGLLVVSIFVNPLQFNSQDDLARYPRTLDADLAMCAGLGVDIVFAPAAHEMYPAPLECTVDVGRLGDHLCGKFRPGHFRGVATVVLKLFEIVRPDVAYFGEKDAQQVAIIRRLVDDFNVPVQIVEVTTVREADGLALSSRNRNLSADERRIAPCLHEALEDARRRILNGERNATRVRDAATAHLQDAVSGFRGLSHTAIDVKLEYLEIVDPRTMQPVGEIAGPVRIAGAWWLGQTRLIDNLLVPLP